MCHWGPALHFPPPSAPSKLGDQKWSSLFVSSKQRPLSHNFNLNYIYCCVYSILGVSKPRLRSQMQLTVNLYLALSQPLIQKLLVLSTEDTQRCALHPESVLRASECLLKAEKTSLLCFPKTKLLVFPITFCGPWNPQRALVRSGRPMQPLEHSPDVFCDVLILRFLLLCT